MSSSRRSRGRRLKRLAANAVVFLLAIITLLLIAGLFLPHRYRVERSLEMRVQPDAIYPWLAALKRWPEWTVWNTEMDPAVQFTYDDPDTGAGAGYYWSGPKLGKESLKLTKAEPGKGVWYDLEFEDGKYQSSGSLTIDPEGDHVRVFWVNEGDLGRNPINRYFGLFMDRMLGGDFEKGLSNLKTKAESAAPR